MQYKTYNQTSQVNFSDKQEVSLPQDTLSYYDNYYEGASNSLLDDNSTSLAPGEIAMWRAVLLQKTIDLKSKSKKRENIKIQESAKKWFQEKTNQEMIKNICDISELNYSHFNKKIIEILHTI